MRTGTIENATNPPLEGGSKKREAVFRRGGCRVVATAPVSRPRAASATSASLNATTHPSPKFDPQISTLPQGEGRIVGFILAALLLFAAPATAGWHEDAAPRDVERLAHLTDSKQKGLDEAANGNPSDLAAIHSILQAGPVAASPSRLTGSWRCRTMKLGGLTPSIVYSWFRCRISERGGRLFFEKLSGSQRTSGYLYPDSDGYVYLGASYVGSGYGPPEKPPAYSGNSASAGAAATPDDQIGLLTLTYDGRARLELPAPVQESTFDVIELKR